MPRGCQSLYKKALPALQTWGIISLAHHQLPTTPSKQPSSTTTTAALDTKNSQQAFFKILSHALHAASPTSTTTHMPSTLGSFKPTTSTMEHSSSADTMSLHSEYTTYSYEKPEPSQKSKRSLRQRLKKTLKEVGYPPTYFYDQEHGTQPKDGYYPVMPLMPPSRL
ncbi:hypothetical protein GQ53DRAFT_829178 [Thozetella sp. PMI_491]|nr:hypothetical protein GQ53DRAFT_829178 [Thozetella sp. PMI_491]